MQQLRQFKFRGKTEESSSFQSLSPRILFIKGAIIPNSFYSLVSGSTPEHFDNNKFYINEGAGDLLVTVVEGNYSNPSDLAAALQTAMITAGTLVYTVSYSTTTRKLTFSAPTNFSMKFGTYTGIYNEICEVLGFLEADTASTTSHSSTYIVQTVPFVSLNLSIDELIGYERTKTAGNLTKISLIHASFPISGASTGMSYYAINSDYMTKINLNGRNINRFTPVLYIANSENVLKKISLNNMKLELIIDLEY